MAMGIHLTKCLFCSAMYRRSLWHSKTMYISEEKSLRVLIGCNSNWRESSAAVAVAMYLMPAQINLVDLDDVSDEKSPRSIQATLSPRLAASNAHPAPVAPPPITNTSYSV
jgi:hypothetical protein